MIINEANFVMHHDYTKGQIMYLHMDSEDIISKPDQLCLAL